MKDADLSDAEIDNICCPLRQNAAKVRHLERMGLRVRKKPDGRPLVNRSHYDALMGDARQERVSEANGPVWGVH